jgi:uncharacterized protein YigE (DUF2233 family)
MHISCINKSKEDFVNYIVDLNQQKLNLYWKNKDGEILKSFGKSKNKIEKEGDELVFAMNGGIFQKNFTPLGLYIKNGEVKHQINKVKNAFGNFYMQPNGIFYVTNDNKGFICKTTDFLNNKIKYATQSGPLLVLNGKINSKFNKSGTSRLIRNGIGILSDGNLLFVMANKPINFYDFANYFKSLGCNNALYLDGVISKIYLPQKEYNSLDGAFGVIIGETKK